MESVLFPVCLRDLSKMYQNSFVSLQKNVYRCKLFGVSTEMTLDRSTCSPRTCSLAYSLKYLAKALKGNVNTRISMFVNSILQLVLSACCVSSGAAYSQL